MSDAYDMLDRFLRNNLGDDDYAEYSAVLDQLAAPAAPAYVPLSDERIAELTGLDYGNPDWRIEYDKYRAVIAADRKLRGEKT